MEQANDTSTSKPQHKKKIERRNSIQPETFKLLSEPVTPDCCSICLGAIKKNTNISKLKCKHKFHFMCLF